MIGLKEEEIKLIKLGEPLNIARLEHNLPKIIEAYKIKKILELCQLLIQITKFQVKKT